MNRLNASPSCRRVVVIAGAFLALAPAIASPLGTIRHTFNSRRAHCHENAMTTEASSGWLSLQWLTSGPLRP